MELKIKINDYVFLNVILTFQLLKTDLLNQQHLQNATAKMGLLSICRKYKQNSNDCTRNTLFFCFGVASHRSAVLFLPEGDMSCPDHRGSSQRILSTIIEKHHY